MAAASMTNPAPLQNTPERIWERAREILLTQLGPVIYKQSVEPLRLGAVSNEGIELVAPDAPRLRWLQTNHPGAIEGALRRAGFAAPVTVVVRPPEHPVRGRTAPGQGELFAGSEPGKRRRSPRFRALVPRYTFESFVIGAGNQFAHAACKAVALQPGNHYNPLFIYGGVGLGKTHLANAIGHETLLRDPDARVAYLSADTFMTELITALRRDRMEDFKNLFRRLDVLIIDDVQYLAKWERTQEEFFHTFNALYESRRQIVLISDTIPKDINGLEERLRNRFEWGLIADIQPPDMETRVAILEKKADLEGLALPRDVAIYIASHVDSNVRELEGHLRRLSATASLSKIAITVDVARTVLRDLIRDRPTVSIETIQRCTCDHYGVRINDLMSRKRTKNFAEARQVAMYLARKMTNESYPAIAQRFAGRDHSTVIHACKTIERRIASDETLRATVERLEQIAQSQA
ncbi:MAG: chromosomal replication initiator protein DnaA [Proteobacteria bacterium]|nr:chromosomal replication initiator protein DnaA [Pseudomonadota bacterium]